MKQAERLPYLLKKNSRKSCSRQELQELFVLLSKSGENELLLLDDLYLKQPQKQLIKDIDWQYMFTHITRHNQTGFQWKVLLMAAVLTGFIISSICLLPLFYI